MLKFARQRLSKTEIATKITKKSLRCTKALTFSANVNPLYANIDAVDAVFFINVSR